MENKKPTIVVSGLIERDGEYLLVNAKTGAPKGLWNNPGGRLEQNESITEGVNREVKEETGYDVEVGNLIGIYQYVSSKLNVLRLIIKCKIVGGKENIPADEIEQIEWFTRDEVINMQKDKITFGAQHTIKNINKLKNYPIKIFDTGDRLP